MNQCTLRGVFPAAIALAAIFFIPLSALCQTYPAKPSGADFVVDEARLIGREEREAINQTASLLLSEQGVPIIVVTIPSLLNYNAAHLTIEQYAGGLFDSWGIGSQKLNYGMLLLVAKNDRRARIELGAGWKHLFDLEAAEVMNKLIVPQFKEGNYSAGILAGVRGMDAMARGLPLPKPKPPWWLPALLIGGIVLTVGIIISLFKNGQRGWGWALIAALAAIIFLILRASASHSGGSFGGGSSGGGGATGSW